MAGERRKYQGGSIRELKSGKWQARVRDPLTNKLESLGTYRLKAQAEVALRNALAKQDQGAWVPPSAGRHTVTDYTAEWIASNRRITSPRTRERYEGLLRLHIGPHLGDKLLPQVTPSMVRKWHATLTTEASASTAAKSYRLLRAVFNTAVADELVARNPCRIDAGGVERPEERPTATVAEVQALADAAPERYRALVLMAAWTSLRFGELAALTRSDVNLLKGTVNVTKNRQRLDDGTSVVLPPKSAAGRRTVAIPPPLRPVLEGHLARFAEDGRDGLMFVGPKGAPLDRSHWNREWRDIREAVGRPDLRFHDLRHTGNMLAAATGATTKQLMARMGHSSMQAALQYQHATEDADQAIADALGEIMDRASVTEMDDRRSS